MRLELHLPALVPQMIEAKILRLFAKEGDSLAIGASLLELEVDLSAFVVHDCPPVSFYRIVLREAAYLNRLAVATGETIAVGQELAVFGRTSEEPLDDGKVRKLRVNAAGIIPRWDEIG